LHEQVVFDTPWFQLVAKTPPGWDSPHYSIRTQDYVNVVAASPETGLLLVRQFRPAVGRVTLELPSGHVEPDEAPEQAARRELLEETGHEAGAMHLLGCLSPDVGRLGNRMWCFFSGELRRVEAHPGEAGLQTVHYRGPLSELLQRMEFDHALQLASVFLAVAQGRLSLDGAPGQE